YKTNLDVAGSQFMSNTAHGGAGGGIHFGAGTDGGVAQGGGLYLYNAGDGYQQLDATFDQNRAIGGDSGPGSGRFAGDAQGGAIYLAKGNLSCTPATTFTKNVAQGGKGGDGQGEATGVPVSPPTSGGFGGNAQGGALYIAVGDLKINQNSFQQNKA